jgi:hypothetical protein
MVGLYAGTAPRVNERKCNAALPCHIPAKHVNLPNNFVRLYRASLSKGKP